MAASPSAVLTDGIVTETEYREFPCDLCDSDSAAEIEVARHYMGAGRLHVCRECGFVYVRRRRTAHAIAASWSDELYETAYTARIPAVRARHAYVAEMADTNLGLLGKRVIDIGAGEGLFLKMIAVAPYRAAPFGVEPSERNGGLMTDAGIEHFTGTIEDFAVAIGTRRERQFDIATILWTLENCQSCNAMLSAARDLLVVGGHAVIATGSRILVPFKKPLHHYLSPNEADTHAFRFSANTLRRLLGRHGFEVVAVNQWIDSDPLVMIARKAEAVEFSSALPIDDWRAVIAFFERWHCETLSHYPRA